MINKEIGNKLESIHDYLCICAEKAWVARDRDEYNMAYSCREKITAVLVWLAILEEQT